MWENLGWHYALYNHGLSIHQDKPGDTCSILYAEEANEDVCNEMQMAGKSKEHILRRLDLLGRAYKCAGL